MMLRGCVLRNTDWVIGIVVATGKDTKLMLNSGETPTKKSRVDRQLNPQILLNFMILFIMCLVVGILSAIYQSAFNFETNNSEFNVPVGDRTIDLNTTPLSEPAYIALLTFASCLIIFQNIIPIAIYISVDVAKMVQVS
jgi:phospholipid-translocating ATPase